MAIVHPEAAADGAVTATDVETSITVTEKGAPARTLEATATRIAFDRAAESLAVERAIPGGADPDVTGLSTLTKPVESLASVVAGAAGAAAITTPAQR